MNYKTLKHIAHSSESLDAGSVQDLVDLTKQFPYFAWPFALLARHYHKKQDYRTEALMHQAAMRVHDRSWLFSLTHESGPSPKIEDTLSENIPDYTQMVDVENPKEKDIPIGVGNTPPIEPVIDKVDTPIKKIEPPIAKEPITKEEIEKPGPKPLFSPATSIYDLERIFSPKDNEDAEQHSGNASNDFYSWLNGKKNQPARSNTPLEGSTNSPNNSTEHQKSIIENFLLTKPSISRPKQEFFKPEKAQKKGEQLTSAIVTETLARIYLKQDNPQKAIWAYQQLQLKFPEKKTYFANLISQIEKEQNKS